MGDLFQVVANNATNKAVEFAVAQNSAILFSTLSIGTWTLIVGLLYFYSKGNDKTLGTPSNIGILFFGLLVTFIADFIVRDGLLKIYESYMFVKFTGVGIVVMCVGAKYLFIYPPDSTIQPIGKHHKSISLIMWIITVPLIILEIVQTSLSIADGSMEIFEIFINMAAIAQKFCQGWVYHFHLSRKVPIQGKNCGASWYFKIIALFNFSQWIQSIIEAESEEEIPTKFKLLIELYVVLSSTYHALMIDYRLFSCLSFIEHAHDIDEEYINGKHIKHVPRTTEYVSFHFSSQFEIDDTFSTKALRLQKCGFFVGSVLIISQITNALMYIKIIGPEVNFFGILAEVFVIVQGFILVKQIRSTLLVKGKWRETNSKGIDLMVGLMGVTVFAFWIFKTLLVVTWATYIHDKYYASFMWCAVKSACRALACLFSIYIYMRTDSSLGNEDNIKYRLRNHFIIPCLMMTYIAVFLNGAIDSYNKEIKNQLKHNNIDIILFAFYESVIPIHLGFCLHLSIHFLLINNTMRDSLHGSSSLYKDVGKVKEDQRSIMQDFESSDDNDDYDVFGKSDQFIDLLDGEKKKFRLV